MNTTIDHNGYYDSLAGNIRNQPGLAHWFPISWRRLSNTRALQVLVAAVMGTAVALSLLEVTTTLPLAQHLSTLAALAAGIGISMATHSLKDQLLSRGLLRATAALGAGIIAYQALVHGWGVLAIAWSILFAWAVTDWIHSGASLRLVALLSGLLVLTGYVITRV